LSLAATFPQLRDAERQHGGLIKGVLAARRLSPSAGPKSAFLTPTGGLGELVAAVENQLRVAGADIRSGSPATTVMPSDRGFIVHLADGGRVQAEAVIVATPAFAAATLLNGVNGPLSGELAAIPHSSTAIVTLAYRREEISHPLDGHGYVVPRVEGGSILACTWSSRKWAGRAPAEWEVIRVFIRRSGREDVLSSDDEGLVALATQEVAVRLGVSAAPALVRIHRWPRGMPQYLMGHGERVARIETALRDHAGLLLAGNAYHGVGLPDCIASGDRAADRAAAHLGAIEARSVPIHVA